MAVDRDYFADMFGEFSITVRRMFGGYGLYHDGLMVAISVGDTLYLKADAETEAAFIAEGCERFSYTRADGRTVSMAYNRAPDYLLDDPQELAQWACSAFQAALRAKAAKSVKKPKTRKSAI